MHRRKIDYYLYQIWLFVLLLMFSFFGFTWSAYQTEDKELFNILFNIIFFISMTLSLTLCINIGFIPMGKIIHTAIDKKRNPEKYKELEKLDREIDKMVKELDEEIEKIIKEKNDGQ